MMTKKKSASVAKNDFHAPVVLKLGIYRHYKGGHYSVIGLGMHHENRKPYVLYVSLTKGTVNIRPLYPVTGDIDGFLTSVTVEGRTVKRFRYIGRSMGKVNAP